MALREGSCNGYPDYRGYRQGHEQQPQKVRVVGGAGGFEGDHPPLFNLQSTGS